MNIFPIHIRPGIGLAVRVLLFALLLIGLMACDESETATDLELCKDYLDDALWDEAIAICPTDTDEGISLSGQARMGRAGVSLLDLMDGLSTSSLSGEALIFDIFSVDVGSTEYTDVNDAVNLFLSISDDATTGDSNRTDSDNFNLVIASDVLLVSLLKEHLSISIDTTTGDFTVPGVTDTGVDTLTSTSTASEYQTVFENIYTNNGVGSGSYYTTTPLNWSDTTRNTDLSRISDIVAANATGANALGDGGLSGDPDLESLSALDFASKIDNGTCGTTNASAVLNFPRRLNTSDSTANYMADELLYVNGDTLEWQGGFPLPSALVNPDFFDVECGGDANAALAEFTTCMEAGTTAISPNTPTATQTLDPSLTTTDTSITGAATGTLCNGSACSTWPLLEIDGDPNTGTEATDNGTTAKRELKQVLNATWPIDSTVTSPTGTTPSYACSAGDNLVHYREYDAYLRTLGQ